MNHHDLAAPGPTSYPGARRRPDRRGPPSPAGAARRAGRCRRRRLDPRGVPGRWGRRLVPHRRRRPRCAPRRPAGRRARLADGARVRRARRGHRDHGDATGAHPAHGGRGLAPRSAAGRLGLRPRTRRGRDRRRHARLDRAVGHRRVHARVRRRRGGHPSPRGHPCDRSLAGPHGGLDDPPVRPGRRVRDRRRLGAGGDLDVVPAALAPRRGRRRLAHSRLVRPGVGRRARRLAGDRLGRRGERDVPAPHEPGSRDPADRALRPGHAERDAVQWVLPARPRVRRRHPHDRHADRGRPRPAAHVPPAGRPPGRRDDAGLGRRAARPSPARRRVRGVPHARPLPHAAVGRGRTAGSRRWSDLRRRLHRSSPLSPAEPSGPAGWPTWGPSCSRSCCTASPRSGSVGWSGRSPRPSGTGVTSDAGAGAPAPFPPAQRRVRTIIGWNPTRTVCRPAWRATARPARWVRECRGTCTRTSRCGFQ